MRQINLIYQITFGFIFITSGSILYAQESVDSSKKESIIVINANKTKGFDKGERSILTGDVILRQDSTIIYAHEAIHNTTNNSAQAYGSVIIQRSDSTNAYCDELSYLGNQFQANMKGNVVLENGKQKIYTEQLDYNMKENFASFNTKSIMTDGEQFIVAKKGKYFLDSSLVIFSDSVVVAGQDYTLRTDSLHFNTQTNTAYFVAPMRMKQGENEIYCEDGFYQLQNNVGELRKNAQYSSHQRKARADTIIFYGKTEDFTLIGNTWVLEGDREVIADKIEYQKSSDVAYLTGNVIYQDSSQTAQGERMEYVLSTGAFKTEGKTEIWQGSQRFSAQHTREIEGTEMIYATGDVFWVDTLQEISLTAQDAYIDKSSNLVKAFGDDLLFISRLEGDSLFVTADTFLTKEYVDTLGNEFQQIFAYDHVVGYKNNMQFVADSLTYNEQDSTFRMFGQPNIWSDTSQFYGDTIFVELSNQKIDRIKMIDNAFVLNKAYKNLYNQVKGRQIVAKFIDQQLQNTHVIGNAESVYYATDEGRNFIGVNDIECGEMKLTFKENKVSKIKFYKKPTSEFHPMQNVNHVDLRLDGFSEDDNRRPRHPLDIYRIYQLLKDEK